MDDQLKDAIHESEIQYTNPCPVRAGGKKEVTFQCSLQWHSFPGELVLSDQFALFKVNSN